MSQSSNYLKYTLILFTIHLSSLIKFCTAQNIPGLENKIYENAKIFENLLKNIGDKNVNNEIRQNLIDQAMELFKDDNVIIETISKKNQVIKKHKIRDYLNRVYDYGYQEVKIEFKHMEIIDNIRMKDDGFYYGTLRIYQIFQGNGIISYQDVTEKDIEVKISKTTIPSGPSYYEVKLGDTRVHRLVPEKETATKTKPTSTRTEDPRP